MSRLGPGGTLGGVRTSNNFFQMMAIAGFVDTVVVKHLEDKIEKSAKELEALMKQKILTNDCGLVGNTSFTQSLKGGSTPLVNSGQLVAGIASKEMPVGSVEIKGGLTNRTRSFFVGIARDIGGKSPSKGHLGKWTAVSLYTVAKNQVRGYTVTLPGKAKIKKVVPKRDFRKEPLAAHKERHKELMKEGAAHAMLLLGRGAGPI